MKPSYKRFSFIYCRLFFFACLFEPWFAVSCLECFSFAQVYTCVLPCVQPIAYPSFPGKRTNRATLSVSRGLPYFSAIFLPFDLCRDLELHDPFDDVPQGRASRVWLFFFFTLCNQVQKVGAASAKRAQLKVVQRSNAFY
uniref:Uncharacterized protein n=1 Tax=Ixodes scapularis TaxID=6945 RepID=A0A4D5RXI1_IXOSC